MLLKTLAAFIAALGGVYAAAQVFDDQLGRNDQVETKTESAPANEAGSEVVEVTPQQQQQQVEGAEERIIILSTTPPSHSSHKKNTPPPTRRRKAAPPAAGANAEINVTVKSWQALYGQSQPSVTAPADAGATSESLLLLIVLIAIAILGGLLVALLLALLTRRGGKGQPASARSSADLAELRAALGIEAAEKMELSGVISGEFEGIRYFQKYRYKMPK